MPNTITNKHNAQFTVKVNNTNSVYSSSFEDITVTINSASGLVDSTTFNKETNFLLDSLDTDNPNPVVKALLTLSYSNAGASSFIGFRISAAAANSNYSFSTTNSTTFNVPDTLPTIALTSASPDNSTVIWQKTTETHTSDGTIPIEINYTANSLPETNPLAINVDFFVMSSETDYDNAIKISVTQDNSTPTPNPLEVLVVTAELTSTLVASSPSDLGTSVTAFDIYDSISFNDTLTTNTDTNYKPINVLNFDESINKAITLNYLYISKVAANSINLVNNTLLDNADTEIEANNYTAINISSGSTTGVTITDDTINIGNQIISVDMSTIPDSSKFFTDENLNSPLYVYIQGKVTSAPQSA